MIEKKNPDYHQGREAAERDLARDAPDQRVARIHLELAELHGLKAAGASGDGLCQG